MIGSLSLRTPLAVFAATACVTGVALVVSDQARSVVDMAPVGVWFANDDADSISHVGPAGTDATVQILRPQGALTVTELDGVAYVTDESGRLLRIDPAQLQVSQEVTLPDEQSQLIGGGGRLYVVDRSTGTIRELDPEGLTTIGKTGPLGEQLGVAVVDPNGVLWVPDERTGEVISVEGRAVTSNRRVAEPGDGLRLSVVNGIVVAVNPTTATVTEIAGGDRAGRTHTIEVDGDPVVPSVVGDGDVLPVVSGARLVALDLRNGSVIRVEVAAPDHRLGTPAIAGNRVYVPDFTAGALIVVDLASKRVVDTLRVTGRPGAFELVVDAGRVFLNDPSTERAWTLDSAGTLVPVAKYDPSRPGNGAGPGVVPPAPPPEPPADDRDEPEDRDDPPRDGDERPTPTTPVRDPDRPPTATTVPPVLIVPPVTTRPPGNQPPATVPTPGRNGQGDGGAGSTPGSTAPPASTTTTTTTIAGAASTGAVTSVVATPGDQQATVTWRAPSGWREVTGYRVVAEPGGASVTVSAGETRATVTGLANGTAVVLAVTALSSEGDGATVRSNSVLPAATRPLDPSGVVAVAGDGQATISWRAPDRGRVSSFTVDVIGGVQPVSVQPGGDQTQVTVTGLVNGTEYYATVRANANGQAGNAVASATFTPAGRPDRPTVNAAVTGPGEVTVSWSAAADNGSPITAYTITAPGLPDRTEPGDRRRTVFTGLAVGATYTFGVVATNAHGSGLPAGSGPVVVQSQVPGAPGNVVATAADGEATVTWSAAPANGSTISEYRVRNVTAGTPATTVPAAQRTAVFRSLVNGTAYEFEVQAYATSGAAGPAVRTNVVTPVGPLPAPTNVVASAAGPTEITVTFDAPSSSNGNPIVHWVVTASPGGATATVTSGSARLTGLTPSTAYTVSVAAVATGGVQGPAATAATATTPAAPPPPVTNLQVINSEINDVTLTWDAAPFADYYMVNPGDGVTPEFRVDATTASWNPPNYYDTSWSATVTAYSNTTGASTPTSVWYWLPPDPRDPCGVPRGQICP